MRLRRHHLILALFAATTIAALLRGESREPDTAASSSPEQSHQTETAATEELRWAEGRDGDVESVAPSAGAVDAASPLTNRSVDGALSSVIFFLELSEEVVQMSPEEGGALQRRYATAATADSTAAELSAQLQELRAVAGPEMSLEVAPISWMVAEIEPQMEYAVSVWYVEVFNLGGPTDVSGAFRTYSAAVQWEDGSWKLGDAEVFDGPQPVVSPEQTSTGFELRAQLAGFSDGGQLVPLLLAVHGEGDR